MTLDDTMVHYNSDPTRQKPQPPHICPKCGSHRTYVIGLSEDGETLAIGCNACGAHSTIAITPDSSAAPVSSAQPAA